MVINIFLNCPQVILKYCGGWESLDQCFSICVYKFPGDLIKMQIWIRQDWGEGEVEHF